MIEASGDPATTTEAAEDSAAPGLSAVHTASTLTLALGVRLVV